MGAAGAMQPQLLAVELTPQPRAGPPPLHGATAGTPGGAKAASSSPRRRRCSFFVWAAIAACAVVFVVTMAVNDCPGQEPRRRCALRFLGRLSFQPLRENLLLGPARATLLDMGALAPARVAHGGQGWRLLSAPWLHAGVLHLASNAAGLAFIGTPLEREFSTARVAVIYLASGLGGALLSALLLPAGQVSVGASGALFGLVGATAAELLANWGLYANKLVALLSLGLVIAINLAIGLAPFVDKFAHIGGLACGTLIGFVLLTKPQRGWAPPPVPVKPASSQPASDGRPLEMGKHHPCQQALRVAAAVSLVVGFTAVAVALFTGVDANAGCSWCRYLSCVPTPLWHCGNAGNSTVACQTWTYANGSGTLTCPNDHRGSHVANFSALSDAGLSSLCAETCG
eukprot:SM000145S00824  [mRNA]  locus=s145:300554:302707:- [translate_table: standard]